MPPNHVRQNVLRDGAAVLVKPLVDLLVESLIPTAVVDLLLPLGGREDRMPQVGRNFFRLCRPWGRGLFATSRGDLSFQCLDLARLRGPLQSVGDTGRKIAQSDQATRRRPTQRASVDSDGVAEEAGQPGLDGLPRYRSSPFAAHWRLSGDASDFSREYDWRRQPPNTSIDGRLAGPDCTAIGSGPLVRYRSSNTPCSISEGRIPSSFCCAAEQIFAPRILGPRVSTDMIEYAAVIFGRIWSGGAAGMLLTYLMSELATNPG